MPRQTGQYRITKAHGEEVRAFVPLPLPPADPPLDETALAAPLRDAVSALEVLAVAGSAVPDMGWFLYGFVRKEAVLSSQIEGTQATIRDVASFEATSASELPDDVEEVCNYVQALEYARAQLADPKGLPVSARLLCETHRILMTGVRGADKSPGEVRRSQNWIGGTRPGNARFVPPPAEEVSPALGALERWIHADDPLHPLIKAGLAHVQFETIHPFLDGNGRVGRMLVTLLLEHWGLLPEPLLYLSLALKARQQEYYARLAAVRTDGDWEGWSVFFLECVAQAARDGVRVARDLHTLVGRDRERIASDAAASVAAIRLLDQLPAHPVVTGTTAAGMLGVTGPTARKALDLLERLGVLRESSGKQRARVYVYHEYLRILTGEGG